ncbi:peptidase M16 inactive domain protein [Mycobacterium ulcerans str. Harvey]|uniref:Peptidase M16 inactive domain protein n=1 Tax=Mycobacterium ulcerans str. Harvey TaxID=1299332 RepID=A0ABN0QV96_MYCUL|nr:peptidase M16 inactive domain protein [Mycobacterium ulcerans str. Harvey]
MIGSTQSVSAMTRAQLHSFHMRRYTPDRMVVAVAGNVDHNQVVGLVCEHFGHAWSAAAGPSPRARHGPGQRHPQLVLADGKPNRPRVVGVRTPDVAGAPLGFVGAAYRARRRIELAAVPGDPRVRGLAYSVYSALDIFADSGALSVYAACLPERFAEVMRVTREVLEAVARDGITESECRIAKGSLRGQGSGVVD